MSSVKRKLGDVEEEEIIAEEDAAKIREGEGVAGMEIDGEEGVEAEALRLEKKQKEKEFEFPPTPFTLEGVKTDVDNLIKAIPEKIGKRQNLNSRIEVLQKVSEGQLNVIQRLGKKYGEEIGKSENLKQSLAENQKEI